MPICFTVTAFFARRRMVLELFSKPAQLFDALFFLVPPIVKLGQTAFDVRLFFCQNIDTLVGISSGETLPFQDTHFGFNQADTAMAVFKRGRRRHLA